MSTLTTLSVFYYGTTVTQENRYIDFDEGGIELNAILNLGSYTATEYCAEVKRALNAAGALDYDYSFNRTTRKITISASGNFTLRTNTGSHTGNNAWSMLGFTTVANKTGAATYTAENGLGSEYRPQYQLDNYVASEDHQVKEQAAVNVSAKGQTQTLFFGNGSRVKMDITVITNKVGLKLDPFYENASGISEFRTFMNFLITKAKVEFMPDVGTRANFVPLILESTDVGRSGVEYQMKNMTKDFYRSGLLTFREAIS